MTPTKGTEMNINQRRHAILDLSLFGLCLVAILTVLTIRVLHTGGSHAGGPHARPTTTHTAPTAPQIAQVIPQACDPDDNTPCPPAWTPFHDVDGHHDCFIAVGGTSVLWCGLPHPYLETS